MGGHLVFGTKLRDFKCYLPSAGFDRGMPWCELLRKPGLQLLAFWGHFTSACDCHIRILHLAGNMLQIKQLIWHSALAVHRYPHVWQELKWLMSKKRLPLTLAAVQQYSYGVHHDSPFKKGSAPLWSVNPRLWVVRLLVSDYGGELNSTTVLLWWKILDNSVSLDSVKHCLACTDVIKAIGPSSMIHFMVHSEVWFPVTLTPLQI